MYCFVTGRLLSNRLWNCWVSDVTSRGQVLNFSPSFQGMSNNFEVKEVSSKVIAVKTLIGEWSDNCASGNGTLNVQHIQFSRQGNTEKVPKQFRRKKFSNLYFKKRKLIFFFKRIISSYVETLKVMHFWAAAWIQIITIHVVTKPY